jgi:hypothetical protein
LQERQAARVLEANMRIDLLGIVSFTPPCPQGQECPAQQRVEISVSNYLFSKELTGKAVEQKEYIETIVEETKTTKVASEITPISAVPLPPMPFEIYTLAAGESVTVNDFVIKVLGIGYNSAEFIVTKKGSGEKVKIELYNGWNLFSIPGRLEMLETSECESSNFKIFEYIEEEKRFVPVTTGKEGQAYWLYNPGKTCTAKGILREAVPMEKLDSIIVGWNFVAITADMIGSKVREIAKACEPKAAYFYNANSRKWENALDRDLSASDLGKAFAIYAAKTCKLGGTTTSPPMPPLPPTPTG